MMRYCSKIEFEKIQPHSARELSSISSVNLFVNFLKLIFS